jgi:hypothetical protein
MNNILHDDGNGVHDGEITTGRDAFESTYDKLFEKPSFIELFNYGKKPQQPPRPASKISPNKKT